MPTPVSPDVFLPSLPIHSFLLVLTYSKLWITMGSCVCPSTLHHDILDVEILASPSKASDIVQTHVNWSALCHVLWFEKQPLSTHCDLVTTLRPPLQPLNHRRSPKALLACCKGKALCPAPLILINNPYPSFCVSNNTSCESA